MPNYKAIDLAFNCVEPEGCLPDKAPIIFLHGVTGCKEYWNDIPQITANATKRKVYVLDARNHGDSAWTDEFDFDCNTDDVLRFMDTINAPSAIIVGHSMGGYTGIRLALTAPERVEHLIVEDIGVSKPRQEGLNVIVMFLNLAQMALERLPPGLDEANASKFILELIAKLVPPEMHSQNSTRKLEFSNFRFALKQKESGGYDFKSNVSTIMEALKNAPGLLSDFEGEFKGPACFIYGTESMVRVRSEEDNIKKFFPHADFVGIEGATHLVHTDCPKEFTEAVLKHLLQK